MRAALSRDTGDGIGDLRRVVTSISIRMLLGIQMRWPFIHSGRKSERFLIPGVPGYMYGVGG